MSTNKLSHLKEGDKIYLELERKICRGDDADGLNFYSKTTGEMWMDDDDTFYTLDDLKKLANDGMPNQGDEIQVGCGDGIYSNNTHKFISFYKGKVVVESNQWGITTYPSWRFPPKKIQKTLAELEKELGYEEGTLEITN